MCKPYKIPRISAKLNPANWTIGPRRDVFRTEHSVYTLDEMIQTLQTIRNDQPGESPVRVWRNDSTVEIYAIGHNRQTVDIFTEDEILG